MPEGDPVLEDIDFETMYQGESPFGGRMPWDIGRPQPEVVALADGGRVRGEVLDVGCGLGDNAIFLASRGHRVTGIDIAPTALGEARNRARAQGVDAEFTVADATTLEGFEGRFRTAIDSSLYHCLTEEDRHRYIAALHRACVPGARLFLFCFSEEIPESFPAPFRISERNLRETVGRDWDIESLEPAEYATNMTPEGLRQAVQAIQPDARLDDGALSALRPDEHGYLTVPVWRLIAHRP